MPFEVYSAHVFNNSFGRVYARARNDHVGTYVLSREEVNLSTADRGGNHHTIIGVWCLFLSSKMSQLFMDGGAPNIIGVWCLYQLQHW